MKTRLFLLSAALVLGLSSCLKETSPAPQDPDTATIDLSQFALSTTMTVTPAAGQVAVVTDADGNVVCRTGVSLTFPVDKAARYTTTYEVGVRSMAVDPATVWMAQYEQTLCFEDADGCDNDYNDLVLYVRQRIVVDDTKPAGHQNVYYLDITPVAAGAANRNGFGFETSAGVTRLITDDYARDFFGDDVFDPARMGSSAFAPVNCAKWRLAEEQPKPYNTITVGGFDLGDNPRINFFVKTASGEKHYISTDPAWPASQRHAALFEGRPFGLAIPGKFAYPGETISIFEAYPDFGAWVAGTKSSFLSGNEVKSKLYLDFPALDVLYQFTGTEEPSAPKLIKSITNGSRVTNYEYDARDRVIVAGSMRIEYIANEVFMWNEGSDEFSKWFGCPYYIDAAGRIDAAYWDRTAYDAYSRDYVYDANNRIVEVKAVDRRGDIHPNYMGYSAMYTWNDAGNIVEMEIPQYVSSGYDRPQEVIPGTIKSVYTYYNLPNKCNLELVRAGSSYFDVEEAYLSKGISHCVPSMLGARCAHLLKSSAPSDGLSKAEYEYTLDQDGYVTCMKTIFSKRNSTAESFSVSSTSESFIEYF